MFLMLRIRSKEDPENVPRYLEALTEIAIDKKSDELQEFVIMEKCKGLHTESEIRDAYGNFGLSYEQGRNLSDGALIGIFNNACSHYMSRFYTNLTHFRDIKAVSMDIDVQDLVMPAGLNNIGNTCYLNSLLQYYFTIKPLRDRVLAFNHPHSPQLPQPTASEATSDSTLNVPTPPQPATLNQMQSVRYESDSASHQPSSALNTVTEITAVDTSPESETSPTSASLLPTQTSETTVAPFSTPEDIVVPSMVVDADVDGDIKMHTEARSVQPEPASLAGSVSSLSSVTKEERRRRHMERAWEFNTQLQRLFASLIWTNAKSISPEKQLCEIALNAPVVDQGASSGVGSSSGGDLSGSGIWMEFGQQQDISECMDNIMDLLEVGLEKDETSAPHNLTTPGSASDASASPATGDVSPSPRKDVNLIKRLFYGATKQTLRFTDRTGSYQVRNKDEEFSHLIVQVAEDLNAALDSYFDRTKVDFEGTEAERTLSIVELPLFMTIKVNRVQFNRETSTFYKSNDYVKYGKKLFLDRYMEQNLIASQERRDYVLKLKQSIKEKRTELEKSTGGTNNSQSRLQMLEHTLDFLLNDPNQTDDHPITTTKIAEAIEKLRGQIEKIEKEIAASQAKLDAAYEGLDGTNAACEYQLHAVFVHEGEASFGHYWIYLWDGEQQRWLKYNDSVVMEVSENEVFRDTTGSKANAYCMVYARSGASQDLLNTFARNDAIRKDYKEKFPETVTIAETAATLAAAAAAVKNKGVGNVEDPNYLMKIDLTNE
ncbi:ubiquitin-specific protease ubp2 [Quaeritorhiza haematococci]|nr:ubiquitin-specific protease ubp2 [Quaeritorhiza haematococci]